VPLAAVPLAGMPLAGMPPLAGVLLAAGVLAEVGYPLASGAGRAALTIAAVLACSAAMLVHAAATRGWRVAAAALACFGAGGFAVEAVGVHTGVPFGAYRYADALGPTALGVPLLVGLAWCMAAWPAYLVAHRLAPGTPRPVRVLLAAAALAAWDLFLDPQMVAAGYWHWQHPSPALPGVPGVPLTNYAGWLLTAALLMTVFEVVAGHAARPGPDAVPLCWYLWAYGSSVLAHAVFLDLPGSALWGGAGMGLIALPLALRLRAKATRR
jgi:uncharacterized membrane protein